MIIPHQQLSPETLQSLVEEFVTRSGTDYGATEIPLQDKVRQVRRQLARGDVVIVFDLATESVTLLSRQEAEQLADQ